MGARGRGGVLGFGLMFFQTRLKQHLHSLTLVVFLSVSLYIPFTESTSEASCLRATGAPAPVASLTFLSDNHYLFPINSFHVPYQFLIFSLHFHIFSVCLSVCLSVFFGWAVDGHTRHKGEFGRATSDVFS